MGEPITYTFVALGQDTVARAFETIGQSAQKGAAAAEGAYAKQTQASKRASAAIKQNAEKVGTEAQRAAEKGAIASARSEEKRAGLVRYTTAQLIREYEREAAAAEAAQKRKAQAFERAAEAIRKTSTSALKGLGSQVMGELGAGWVTSISGITGKIVGTIAGATREAWKLQAMAKRIAIDARAPGETMADPTAIRRDLERAAIANPGVEAAEVGSSVSEYRRRTGDLSSARAYAGVFATAKSALGDQASGEDIGKVGAVLAKRFDIHGVEAMGDAIAHVVFMAKQTGQPLEQVVTKFDKLGAAAKGYGLGAGAEGMGRLNALNTFARAGVGDQMAPAAVAGLLQSLKANAHKIKIASHGKADPYLLDKSGNTAPIEQTLANIFAHVGSSTNMGAKGTAVKAALGARGMKAVDPLFDVYKSTFTGTQGTTEQKTAAASQAVIEAFSKAAQSTGSYAELQKDAAAAQDSASAQATAAMQELQAKIAEAVLPALGQIAKTLAKGGLVEALDPAVTMLTALAEAGVLVVDVFKSLGLIKPKQTSPQEHLEQTKKALADYEKALPTGPETPAQMAQHDALRKAVEDADQAARGATPGLQGQARMTPEDFAKRYAELSGATGEDLDEKRNDALGLGKTLKANPNDAIASNDWLQGLGGDENAAQKRLRHDFQDQSAGEKMGNPGAVSLDGAAQLNKQLVQLGQTAAETDAKLKKLGNPGGSIAPGTHL